MRPIARPLMLTQIARRLLELFAATALTSALRRGEERLSSRSSCHASNVLNLITRDVAATWSPTRRLCGLPRAPRTSAPRRCTRPKLSDAHQVCTTVMISYLAPGRTGKLFRWLQMNSQRRRRMAGRRAITPRDLTCPSHICIPLSCKKRAIGNLAQRARRKNGGTGRKWRGDGHVKNESFTAAARPFQASRHGCFVT